MPPSNLPPTQPGEPQPPLGIPPLPPQSAQPMLGNPAGPSSQPTPSPGATPPPGPPPKPHHRIMLMALLIGGIVAIVGFMGFIVYSQTLGKDDFITRKGTRLYDGRKLYRFNGFNAPGMLGCKGVGVAEWTADAEEREQYFAALAPNTITRLYYVDTRYADNLDEIVQTAKRHDQRLMITLSGHQGACAGETLKTSTWYTRDYKGSYMRRLDQVTQRYANDPTIAIWEPMGAAAGDTEVLQHFFQATADAIKANAPHQLVSSGMGLPGSIATAEQYRAVHQVPNIDIASLQDTSTVASLPQNFAFVESALQGIPRPLIVQWQLLGSGGEDRHEACDEFTERVQVAKDKMSTYFDKKQVVGMIYDFAGPRNDRDCSSAAAFRDTDDTLFDVITGYQIPGMPARTSWFGHPVSANTEVPVDTQQSTSLLEAPQNLRALLITSKSVVFAWQPSSTPNLAGYNVFRNGVISSTSVAPQYTDTDLTPDTNYTYRISAYDQQGQIGGDSRLLALSTTVPEAGSDDGAAAAPLAMTVLGSSNPVAIAPRDRPVASETLGISNPSQQSKSIRKTELLVNKRVRATATEAPFALALNTKTLTNATHELTYKVHYRDGSSVASTRQIVARNNLTLFENVRNSALEPLAGSSGAFLNITFGVLAAMVLAVPVMIVVAFKKLRGVEIQAERYTQNKWEGF